MVIFGDFNVTSVENQGIVVGVATAMCRLRYGMNGPGCETRYGQEIFLFSKTFSSSLLFNGNRGKAAGAWSYHSSPSTVFDGV